MSEYDIQGKCLCEWLTKPYHYFDKDNGVVEAKEMKGLMF